MMCAKHVLAPSIGLGSSRNGTLNWIVTPSLSSFIPRSLPPINKQFWTPELTRYLDFYMYSRFLWKIWIKMGSQFPTKESRQRGSLQMSRREERSGERWSPVLHLFTSVPNPGAEGSYIYKMQRGCLLLGIWQGLREPGRGESRTFLQHTYTLKLHFI